MSVVTGVGRQEYSSYQDIVGRTNRCIIVEGALYQASLGVGNLRCSGLFIIMPGVGIVILQLTHLNRDPSSARHVLPI